MQYDFLAEEGFNIGFVRYVFMLIQAHSTQQSFGRSTSTPCIALAYSIHISNSDITCHCSSLIHCRRFCHPIISTDHLCRFWLPDAPTFQLPVIVPRLDPVDSRNQDSQLVPDFPGANQSLHGDNYGNFGVVVRLS